MDFAPERLTEPCSPTTAPDGTAVACGSGYTSSGGVTTNNYLRPDNAGWAKLVSQYAIALAPPPFHPARTTGYGGFELSLYGTITGVSHNADYFHKGTEGPLSTNNTYPSTNASPDPVLQVYGVAGRKGLPYGFELQASAGYIADTELVTLGAGIRWAIFEGFRKGMSQYIPDVSVGGYVTTMNGSSKVHITVPTLDVQVSKPFVIANQVVMQPYVAYQVMWLLADSGVIDATPGTNALANCNARPPTVSETTSSDNGDLHCQGANGPNARLDLNNDMVFESVRFRTARIAAGLSFRYEVLTIALHVASTLGDPTGTDAARVSGMGSQLTGGLQLGAVW